MYIKLKDLHKCNRPLLRVGATCPGGTFGMQTPLLSLQNYWRSGNTSSSMYHCPFLNACHGYPNYPGVDAGDAACRTGYYGPVCQVCLNGWYGYSQGCKYAVPPYAPQTA